MCVSAAQPQFWAAAEPRACMACVWVFPRRCGEGVKVKLIDFGMATLEREVFNEVRGKPSYQARGGAAPGGVAAGARCDAGDTRFSARAWDAPLGRTTPNQEVWLGDGSASRNPSRGIDLCMFCPSDALTPSLFSDPAAQTGSGVMRRWSPRPRSSREHAPGQRAGTSARRLWKSVSRRDVVVAAAR